MHVACCVLAVKATSVPGNSSGGGASGQLAWCRSRQIADASCKLLQRWGLLEAPAEHTKPPPASLPKGTRILPALIVILNNIVATCFRLLQPCFHDFCRRIQAIANGSAPEQIILWKAVQPKVAGQQTKVTICYS